ncbi:MAG TPA: hypothetical protein VH136_18540 [Trebonia sp.]|jgi:hypothetical protein|nr:hypothetical protein [Trebonia sp.]
MSVARHEHGKGHRYKVDGQWVPGVTTILGKTMPKPGLVNWSARCAADEAVSCWDELAELPDEVIHNRLLTAHRRDLDVAAKRGTEIHKIAAALNDGLDAEVPEELEGHIDAYRDFLRVVRPVPLLNGTELVVANRTHRYCGTVDLVADLPALTLGGEHIPADRWLLELKSTRSKIWPESAIQACAYTKAEVFVDPAAPEDERRMEWLGVHRTGVVWIRSDCWEFRPVSTTDATWDYFLSLRWQYDHRDELDTWIGGTLAPAELEAV